MKEIAEVVAEKANDVEGLERVLGFAPRLSSGLRFSDKRSC